MIKKRYDAVDLCKWICSFLIIYIHVAPVLMGAPAVDRIMAQGVCRVAVPFFFAASSFFLFARMGEQKSAAKQNRKALLKFCGHILLMYTIWIVIYSAYYVFYYAYNGLPQKSVIEYVLGFFFAGGLQQHLWYLIATVYAAPVVYLLWHGGRKTLIISIAVLEILCCLEWPYRFAPFISKEIHTFLCTDATLPFNALLNGVPMMCLGVLCLMDHSKRSNLQWLIWLAVAAVLYAAEVTELYLYFGASFSSAGMFTRGLLTYSLLNFLLTANFQLPVKWLGKVFRLSSTWNYCIHMLVMMLMGWFVAYTGVKKYVIVVFLTVISGIPYIFIKLLLDKRKKKVLQN
jgi:serine/alanine racemase